MALSACTPYLGLKPLQSSNHHRPRIVKIHGCVCYIRYRRCWPTDTNNNCLFITITLKRHRPSSLAPVTGSASVKLPHLPHYFPHTSSFSASLHLVLLHLGLLDTSHPLHRPPQRRSPEPKHHNPQPQSVPQPRRESQAPRCRRRHQHRPDQGAKAEETTHRVRRPAHPLPPQRQPRENPHRKGKAMRREESPRQPPKRAHHPRRERGLKNQYRECQLQQSAKDHALLVSSSAAVGVIASCRQRPVKAPRTPLRVAVKLFLRISLDGLHATPPSSERRLGVNVLATPILPRAGFHGLATSCLCPLGKPGSRGGLGALGFCGRRRGGLEFLLVAAVEIRPA